MHPLTFPVDEVTGLAPCDGEAAPVAATEAATEAFAEGDAGVEVEGETAGEVLALGEAETGLLELETWA